MNVIKEAIGKFRNRVDIRDENLDYFLVKKPKL